MRSLTNFFDPRTIRSRKERREALEVARRAGALVRIGNKIFVGPPGSRQPVGFTKVARLCGCSRSTVDSVVERLGIGECASGRRFVWIDQIAMITAGILAVGVSRVTLDKERMKAHAKAMQKARKQREAVKIPDRGLAKGTRGDGRTGKRARRKGGDQNPAARA